ncbi:MAG: metalloregulator ArsR/SmtB family transcription factor [Thermodesulfobacteriota bacterium]
MSKYRNNELQKFAEMFKALSNPHRLEIFLRLVECCPPGTKCSANGDGRQYVGQLGAELDVAASTVSHHIKELRHAGLIKIERQGKNIQCWVDQEAVNAMGAVLAGCIPSEESEAT